jgi:hypothetical protein
VSLTPNAPEPLDAVLDRLAVEPSAWVRLAATRYDEAWEVEVCDIVTGSPPASWRAERLIYSDDIFIAVRTKGSTVVRWLRQGATRLDGTRLSFPDLNANPQVQREAGNAHSAYESSRWPRVQTDLIGGMAPPNRQQPQQMLVRSGIPTFQNFATAARYLLRDDPTTESTIYRRISYRHLDTSARIALVEYTEEDIWVSLEGDHLAGVTVELMGSSPGPTKTLKRAPRRPVHMKLENGLPRNAFVVLVQGDQPLDRKTIGWEYPSMQDPDVRRLVKFDPSARLQALLYNKENERVEFKQGVIGDSDSDKETVMKTVAAFANGDGGSVFFGINKRYEVIGLSEGAIPKFQDSVSDMIDDWVHPAPAWAFDLLTVQGSHSRLVVELMVSPGAWPPYGVGTTRRSLRYYVRHAARSLPARPDEVRALARSRPPSEPPGGALMLH